MRLSTLVSSSVQTDLFLLWQHMGRLKQYMPRQRWFSKNIKPFCTWAPLQKMTAPSRAKRPNYSPWHAAEGSWETLIPNGLRLKRSDANEHTGCWLEELLIGWRQGRGGGVIKQTPLPPWWLVCDSVNGNCGAECEGCGRGWAQQEVGLGVNFCKTTQVHYTTRIKQPPAQLTPQSVTASDAADETTQGCLDMPGSNASSRSVRPARAAGHFSQSSPPLCSSTPRGFGDIRSLWFRVHSRVVNWPPVINGSIDQLHKSHLWAYRSAVTVKGKTKELLWQVCMSLQDMDNYN